MDETPDEMLAAPAAPAAERALLGALIADPDLLDDITGQITRDDFYDRNNQKLFDTLIAMQADGRPIDIVLVDDALRQSQDTRPIPPTYLADLLDEAAVPEVVPGYLAILARKSLARQLMASGRTVTSLGQDLATSNDEDVTGLLSRANEIVYEVGESRLAATGLKSLDVLLVDTLEELDADAPDDDHSGPVATGFTELDSLLGGGMLPGQFIIVAARPGIGKSTLAGDIVRHTAIECSIPSAVFTLEMSHKDWMHRLLSATASIPLNNLRGGKLESDADWNQLGAVVGKLSAAPLYIDETANLTVEELSSKARALQRRHGLRILVVDYIQLMSSAKRVDSRQQEVSEISRRLKVLAKELGITVIGVAQLNRGPEQRADKKPQASDLRETGQLEQDADGIWLIYREDSFDPDTTRAGEADVIVAKQRNGPTGSISLAFQSNYSRFANMPSGGGFSSKSGQSSYGAAADDIWG